jgi:hypothetical protein
MMDICASNSRIKKMIMKKQFHRLVNTSILLSGLSVISANNLSAQTYAPYITAPFNLSGIGGAQEPTFADLDNDGDLDVFSGSDAGPNGSTMIYYQNIGTKKNPNFAVGVMDPFNFDYSGAFFDLTFVDLDNDGDLDLMSGNQSGESKYFENIGTASVPNFAPMVTNPFGLYSVGYLSSPTFADIDNDGDQDVLIGEYSGGMYYFQNIGTPSAPAFAAHQILPFGLSNVGNATKPQFIDMDHDGDQDLLVGVENGPHYYFQNIGTASAPNFAAAVLNPFGISNTPQIYAAPVFGDLDFDGDMDLLCGDNSSIFKYFENTSPVPIPPTPASSSAPEDLFVCYGTSATLSASGVITGTIGWYDTPTGGNWLGGGETFTTSSLFANTTIYAQDSTNGGPSASRIAVTISVTTPVIAQTLIASQSNLCVGGSVSIETASSESGVNYHLYLLVDSTYYGGTLSGNGFPLIFNTPYITVTQDFDVVAQSSTTQGAITLSCTQRMNSLITITVDQPETRTESISVCHGENYTYIDGTVSMAITADESHISTIAGVASNGCDSILTENIISLPQLMSLVTTTICAEESITINGTVYDASNSTGTEIFPNIGANGCDSTVTINLNVLPLLSGSVTTTICAEESMTINSTVYNASNPTGTEVFTNIGANGCDSTVTINLTVLPALAGSVTSTICAEESMTINGTVYDASNLTGTEIFTNIGANGCDSTVTINLNVLPAITSTYSPIVCMNESIVINGTTYDITHAGGTEVFTSSTGCDSTVTISLLIPAINTFTTTNSTTITALPGMTYQWIDCSTNQPISGATAQSFAATFNGNYAVIVTQDGCSDTSQCVAITTVGLSENHLSTLSLYPNPTENSFTISGLENLSNVGAIQILDLNGKQISSLNTNASTCDISLLESGMYYLKVVHETGTEIIRFIKK